MYERRNLEATFTPGRASVSGELVVRRRSAEVVSVEPYRGERRMPKQPAERRRKRWDPTSVPIWALLLLRTSPVLLTGLAVLVLWGANR